MKKTSQKGTALLIGMLLLCSCAANQPEQSEQQNQSTEQASSESSDEPAEPVSNAQSDQTLVGTGPKGGPNEAMDWQWVPSYQEEDKWYRDQYDDYTAEGIAYHTNVITVTGMRSLSAQQRLNELIQTRQQQLISDMESQQEWLDAVQHSIEDGFEVDLSCYSSICCRGHYISVSYWGYGSVWRNNAQTGYYESFYSVSRSDSFVYDVDRMQVAALGDLFYQGSDYYGLMDHAVRRQLDAWWSWEDVLKRPFETLQGTTLSVSFADNSTDSSLIITLPKDNRYFDFGSDYSFFIEFNQLADVLVCYGQNPADILRTPSVRMLQYSDFSDATLTDMPGMEQIQAYSYEGAFQSLRLTGEEQAANAAIEALEQQVAAQFNYERLTMGYANVTVNYAQCGLADAKRCGDRLVLSYVGYLDTNIGFFSREWHRLIDLETGRALTLREVLNPWQMDEIKSQEGWNDLFLDSPDFSLEADGSISLWILDGPYTGTDEQRYLTLQDCYNWN